MKPRPVPVQAMLAFGTNLWLPSGILGIASGVMIWLCGAASMRVRSPSSLNRNLELLCLSIFSRVMQT